MGIAKIQTGDKVKVITGQFKNIEGQVIRVQKTKTNKGLSVRACVSGVPQITKYRKSFTNANQTYPGYQYQVDRLIDISNLRLVTSDGQTTGVKIEKKDGKKFRIMKKNGQMVVKNKIIKTKPNTNTNTETALK